MKRRSFGRSRVESGFFFARTPLPRTPRRSSPCQRRAFLFSIPAIFPIFPLFFLFFFPFLRVFPPRAAQPHTIGKFFKIVSARPCAVLFLCYIIRHVKDIFRKIVKFYVPCRRRASRGAFFRKTPRTEPFVAPTFQAPKPPRRRKLCSNALVVAGGETVYCSPPLERSFFVGFCDDSSVFRVRFRRRFSTAVLERFFFSPRIFQATIKHSRF